MRLPESQPRRLPRTEERLFPAIRRIEDQMLAEHWARYRFAERSIQGRVLDLGCGTGYGARELARSGRVAEVVAVDKSETALSWAGRSYPDPKVSLQAVDLLMDRWGGELGSFDAIIAFEILEHLVAEEAFWRGVDRALKPNGLLWISSPLGRGRGRPCAHRFHAHQLRRREIEALLDDGWTKERFGQTGGWIEPWVAGRRYYTMLMRTHRRETP